MYDKYFVRSFAFEISDIEPTPAQAQAQAQTQTQTHTRARERIEAREETANRFSFRFCIGQKEGGTIKRLGVLRKQPSRVSASHACANGYLRARACVRAREAHGCHRGSAVVAWPWPSGLRPPFWLFRALRPAFGLSLLVSPYA